MSAVSKSTLLFFSSVSKRGGKAEADKELVGGWKGTLVAADEPMEKTRQLRQLCVSVHAAFPLFCHYTLYIYWRAALPSTLGLLIYMSAYLEYMQQHAGFEANNKADMARWHSTGCGSQSRLFPLLFGNC